MKNIKNIFIFCLFALFTLMLVNTSYAGEQAWNALDYNVILNTDGSADIVETWDVDISETNTMFKDFDLSSDSSYFIDDVKVIRVEQGQEVPLEQIYEEQYHVDPNCYYGLMINSDTFEIAWNVGLDNSSDTRIYKIYYTVENAVKIYSDCTEFYWQFLSDENSMSGRNVTGTVTLPRGITDIEKLRVWGHGDFSGNIEKVSTEQVQFNMNTLHSNSMLEIRIVTEDNIFEESINKYNTPKLSSILEEEQRWADEANAQRARAKTMFIAVGLVILIIFCIYLRKIIKYINAGKELKLQEYPKSELQYFRDIPNEKNATPARAAYLYYFRNVNSSFENYTSKIFSATLLQLTLKKYITLEPEGKKNVRINILPKTNELVPLEKDEQIIYDLIIKASKTNDSITTEEFEKYAKRNYDDFYDYMKKVCKEAKEYEINSGAIDEQRKKLSTKWSGKGGAYIVGIFLFFMFAPLIVILFPILIEFIICAVLCFKNAGKISALSEKGYEESCQWKALKKYMEDFSLLKEKEVPDLILWEKFLVYATTFGISKKVLDQLVEVYPQMTSEDYYRNGHYTYLYMASHNSGLDSLDNLDRAFSDIAKTASSAYSAAHSSSSSGSGGGGGFSGGGGGRRRRWKLRRQIKYNINFIVKNL